MKDLSFVSNVNGLVVSAPADAYPAPNCSDTMCPIQEQAEAFACTPQLVPSTETPLMFRVALVELAPGLAVALFDGSGDGGWVIGSAPDGTPVNLQELQLYSYSDNGETRFIYKDITAYGGVHVTVYDAAGNYVINDYNVLPTGPTTYQLVIEDGTLLATGTYCVQVTFTPVEP